jgi:hypothetical protein
VDRKHVDSSLSGHEAELATMTKHGGVRKYVLSKLSSTIGEILNKLDIRTISSSDTRATPEQ